MHLLEREAELAVLEASAAGCFTGKGQIAIVTGPVASGKTELLHAFADRATAISVRYIGAAASKTERALPLGVIAQVFFEARLPAAQAERASQLLEDGMAGTALFEPRPLAPGHTTGHVTRELCEILLDLARQQPLAIGIDDLHHADPLSIECLAHLARRSRSVPLMLVATESIRPRPASGPYTELLSQPHSRRVSLGLLSPAGVRALLRSPFGAPVAGRLAKDCHAVSRGNPLLTHALIEDNQDLDPGSAPRLVAGTAFGRAFLRCLYGCDQTMITVAVWTAVLEAWATPARLARLAGEDAGSVRQAIGALDASGLLANGQFTDTAAHLAVLDSVSPEARTGMHVRAATLLYEDGVPARVIAEHLLAADHVGPDWAASVLVEAAEYALGNGDVERAVSYLRLALRAYSDAPRRAGVLIRLADAQWRVNPSVVNRHLDELIAAVRAGLVTGRPGFTVVSWLAWFGRADEAMQLLAHLAVSDDPSDEDLQSDVHSAYAELARVYPAQVLPVLEGLRARTGGPTADAASSRLHPERWASDLVSSALRGGDRDALTAAGQSLREYPLDERTWPIIRPVLSALIYSEQLGIAARCCEWFLERAEEQRAVVWWVMLACLRAEIAMRQGALATANRYAHMALTLVSPRSWGVVLGYPVSLLVRACTAMGHHDEALRYVRLPVPDAMFTSTIGLSYLHARGVYYRASGRDSAALADFETCGELMRQWRMDVPQFVPWRIEVAQTRLQMGQLEPARHLAVEQLDRLAPGDHRHRGACLRILAVTGPTVDRLRLLTEAVEALRTCEDRIGLVQALVDLGATQQSFGQPGRARMTLHQARQLAEQCGMPASERLPAARPLRPARGGHDRDAQLSQAERRVAGLAAQGLTNSQIAARLHVTVSTVEQHLTRVYRKLRISRRGDLPGAIAAEEAS